MRDFISSKMSTIGLSGIRKVNEKALAMEREGLPWSARERR